MIQLFEVFLALIITIFFLFYIIQEKEESTLGENIIMKVYSQLFSLDKAGLLREYVYSNNTQKIKNAIEEIVPPFYVDVKICYPNEKCEIDDYKGKVFVIKYYLSGYIEYNPLKLMVIVHE